MQKFVTYYRVSTAKQGQSGLGLEAQQKAVNDYLVKVNGLIIGAFTEVASGKDNDRQQLAAALRQCKLTGAVLLIAKLDRLSRNRRFLMELDESAVNFICVDMPEANRLTIGLMACLADYEAQLISERTKAALQAAKARGVKLGNPTLALVRPTDTTAATKARSKKAAEYKENIKQLIAELEAERGEMSSRQMAQALTDAGYLTSTGKPFNHVAVIKAKAA